VGIAGGSVVLLIVLGLAAALFRRRRGAARAATAPAALPAGAGAPAALPLDQAFEAQLAERDALQQQLDAKALNSLKLTPPITKTAEVMARHIREKIKKEPEVSAQVLHSWIREEDV
jgi:flagellar biosynthesis/type III secretory pathway M-ring protein FliF/YscJ